MFPQSVDYLCHYVDNCMHFAKRQIRFRLCSIFLTDRRYVGCFEDVLWDSSDSNETTVIWEKSSNHSASLCIDDCLKRGYRYSAMLNASSCSCGNTLYNVTDEHFDNCRLQCSEKSHESCGGPSSYAVYNTDLGTLSAEFFENCKFVEKAKFFRFLKVLTFTSNLLYRMATDFKNSNRFGYLSYCHKESTIPQNLSFFKTSDFNIDFDSLSVYGFLQIQMDLNQQ